MKDLTNTAITRQNILNNPFAVVEIHQAVGIKGVLFENEYKFLKRQIADSIINMQQRNSVSSNN